MSFRVGATAGDSGPSRYSEESESGPRGLQTQGADVLARLAENWPALAALRAAASSRQRSRLPAEVSSLVNELRVAFAAALLVSMPDDRGVRSLEDAAAAADAVDRAWRLYQSARSLVLDCGPALDTVWRMTAAQVSLIVSHVSGAVGLLPRSPPSPSGCPISPPRPEACLFEQSSHLFLAAVAQGFDFQQALASFAAVGLGRYSHDDRCFYPESSVLGPLSVRPSIMARADRFTIEGAAGEGCVTVFFSQGSICAFVADQRLRARRLADIHRARGGLLSLPEFICLPRDEAGRPIIPSSRVTALVEAQEAWHTELGQIDGVSSAIVRGLLVMPKISAPLQQTVLRNHPSFENDAAAKAALGPVIAKWLAEGVLEYVGWNDRVPVLLQPCGAVPKGSPPFYRLITDARFANHMYSDWGVSYTSAAQLSTALHRCDFTFSADLQDAYHLAVWKGCGGELRPIKRPIITGPGEVSWIDALVNGCTPATCKGGCDKDMSGILIEGHIFRFAACQFGQKTAGSPLHSLVRCVARYFARLPHPVHVAAWVDDLHFSLSTPPHPPCAGFEGGCPVCVEYYGYAVAAERLWKEKARKLNLPLSGKGHSVAQRGPYTGVLIDTFRGLYIMLPDKLQGLVVSLQQLLACASPTPRLVSRPRGKLLHYDCALQYLRVPAASLSQFMHGAEVGLGPFAVPSLRDEADAPFEWDRPLGLVSSRARHAIQFALEAISRFGARGQPIWPVVPSSLYGAFLDGRLGHLRVLVITFDASVYGWGAVLRTSPHEPGIIVVSGFREAAALEGLSSLDSQLVSDDPVAQVYREALAGYLALLAASQHFELGRYSVLLRNDCTGALSTLRKGSFRSPALQDVALKFAELCVRLDVSPPPSFLYAPGEVLKAEGVDGLSRAAAQEQRVLESTPALRCLVREEAARLGWTISVDLFASSSNCLVPRFFARYPEPLAEAVDALAQPDWAYSCCQACHRSHRECCFVFPPRFLLAKTLRKAEVDGLRGIFVVPFAITDPSWPVLMRSSVSGGRDRCRVVDCDSRFVSNSASAGIQRLAIIAVDFHRLSQRPDTGAAPPCGQESELRLRRPLQSSLDEEDRRQIGLALQLGGAGSPATVAPGSHASGLPSLGQGSPRRRLR